MFLRGWLRTHMVKSSRLIFRAHRLHTSKRIFACSCEDGFNESLRPDSGGVINMLRSSQQCT